MVKRPNLAAAMQAASGKLEPEPEQKAPEVLPTVGLMSVPASRIGKKAVTGHFDPAVGKQLKQIALDQDKTMQALLAEAMNDLFFKYGKNPLA
jgi:hypothetical protein